MCYHFECGGFMATFWWQDEDADDEEDLNAGARKVYLEEKGINANSLAKRFNEIIKAQSQTVDASLYAADREYKRFLRYVKKSKNWKINIKLMWIFGTQLYITSKHLVFMKPKKE